MRYLRGVLGGLAVAAGFIVVAIAGAAWWIWYKQGEWLWGSSIIGVDMRAVLIVVIGAVLMFMAGSYWTFRRSR